MVKDSVETALSNEVSSPYGMMIGIPRNHEITSRKIIPKTAPSWVVLGGVFFLEDSCEKHMPKWDWKHDNGIQ